MFAYKSGIIKPSDNLKLGIFAATAGIGIFYLISIVGMFFGLSFEILNPFNGSITSILISLFIVIIASLNLVLDFDFIEESSENGDPKYQVMDNSRLVPVLTAALKEAIAKIETLETKVAALEG